MSDSNITTALETATRNPARLTRIQVYHLTLAGLLGLDDEGNFVVTPKAEKKAQRGKTKALIAQWAPEVRRAVMTPEAHLSLDKDGNRKITFDSVWKFLGCPDKGTNRSAMLATMTEMTEEGVLTKIRPNNSNFGIYYILTPQD